MEETQFLDNFHRQFSQSPLTASMSILAEKPKQLNRFLFYLLKQVFWKEYGIR